MTAQLNLVGEPEAEAPAPDSRTAQELGTALVAALHRRFAPPEWLTVDEVLIEERRIDVVAVRMWTRTSILAFEIKASRSDWLREMKRPEKADTVMGHCDEFWLATAKGVARPEEVPEHWGWFVLQPNGTIRIVKRAPSLKTKIPGRVFWASMLARAYRGGAGRQEVEEARRAEYERGYRDGERRMQRLQESAGAHEREQAAELVKLRSALGGMTAWDIEQHAAVIRAAVAGARAERRVQELRDSAQRAVELLDAVLAGQDPAML